MDDTDSIVKSVRNYAVKDETSPFDKVLPKEPEKLPIQPNRIPYQTQAGTTRVVTLKKKNKYHRIIFTACALGFQSDWFAGLSDRSKPGYFDQVLHYFDWINESGHNTTDKTRYESLRVYEAYQMNDRGLKRSPLSVINAVIRGGLSSSKISDFEHDFLQTLLGLSGPAKSSEPRSVTLSNWLGLPWLRALIGERMYLQLESPRLLLKSFQVTIATTLLYLLEQRQHWPQSSILESETSSACWYYDWNPRLLERIGRFNKQGVPEDEISELLWLDLVKPTKQDALKAKLNQAQPDRSMGKFWHQNKKMFPWQKPAFFHPSYQTRYSYVEQSLCAWLMACEAIQPTDIPKLKTNNFTRERTNSGRLVAMECTYYKGRSGTFKQPAILMGSDPWTRAIDMYMKGLSSPALFENRVAVQDAFSISTSRHNSVSRHNAVELLFKIWKLPSFQYRLESELRRSEASPLFLHAALALEHGDESYPLFYHRTKKRVDEYRATVSRPLPASLFTLTHIKNTAVHAGSDAYRESDLINHHSHTSMTEKTSYLTDQNKEWVNQAGRITRLVLHDLEKVVFQPSITAISQSVHDLELRSKVRDVTHSNDIVIQSIQSSPIESEGDNTLIVTDTSDTALYFIHYITQAEALLPKLLAVRPDWVERELIVQVEWMTRMLTRMRTAVAAQKNYVKLAVHLPPLFDHLLETTE